MPSWLHARHHAKMRTYVYRVVAPVAAHDLSVFEYNRAWMFPEDLALAPMQQAAAALIGTHDFSSFRAAGALATAAVRRCSCGCSLAWGLYAACQSWRRWVCQQPGLGILRGARRGHLGITMRTIVAACCFLWLAEFERCCDPRERVHERCPAKWPTKPELPRCAGCAAPSPIKTIEKMDIERCPCIASWAVPSKRSPFRDGSASQIVVTVRARSFLYHQIRLMVAWLVEVGTGSRHAHETPCVLASKSVNAIGRKMAPPWGLYLADVEYDEQDVQGFASRDENTEGRP